MRSSYSPITRSILPAIHWLSQQPYRRLAFCYTLPEHRNRLLR